MGSDDDKMIAMNECLQHGHNELERGNPDAAIEWYRKGSTVNSQSSWPDFNIANVLRDQGKFRDAVDSYLAAIRKEPHDPDSYRNLALLYNQMGKPKEAAKELESCVKESNGADPRDYFNLACLYDHLGNQLGSTVNYQRFLSAKPVGCEELVAIAKRRIEQLKNDMGFGG